MQDVRMLTAEETAAVFGGTGPGGHGSGGGNGTGGGTGNGDGLGWLRGAVSAVGDALSGLYHAIVG